MNESTTALLIVSFLFWFFVSHMGLCTGAVILLTSGGKFSRVFELNEEFFFIYLLPPIIFNAGFQVKKKQFFQNFMKIMLFGAIGTSVSFSIISFGAMHLLKFLGTSFLETTDYLAIGAIFSATDSVCTLQVLNQEETPLLYSIVFGEGVVNDAASVVLFNAIQKFDLSHINPGTAFRFGGSFLILFITSTLLGVFVGLFSAYITKKLHLGRHSPDREVSLMILMAYLSYTMAELFDLSGILTIFFCGIVMSHYTWHSMNDSSKITTRHASATSSFISEICIFLYVGMDALDIEKWKFARHSPGKSVGLNLILLSLVLIGRAAFVFPLSFIMNLGIKSKNDQIQFNQQVTIWWAGLMRGAVSMALAYNQFTRFGRTQQPGNAIMITSTISVVLFSTMVFGLLTKPIVRLLMPPSALASHISEPSSPKSLVLPLVDSSLDTECGTCDNKFQRPPSLSMLLRTPTRTVHGYWRKFDDAYMRPLFVDDRDKPDSPPQNGVHYFQRYVNT